VVGKEIVVKKYVVRLSAEERAQLDELIRKGKRSAQLLTKARILLNGERLNREIDAAAVDCLDAAAGIGVRSSLARPGSKLSSRGDEFRWQPPPTST
jgi:hypothetical protein